MAFFSFRNEVTEYYRDNLTNPISVMPGTEIVAGALANLLTRQMHRGISLMPSTGVTSGIQVLVRGPIITDEPPPDNRGRAEVRVVAILGLEKPPFPDAKQYLHVYGYDTVVGEWIPLRHWEVGRPPHETSTAPVNVVFTAPWDDGETGRFLAYRIDFEFRTFDFEPLAATFGGIWIGNAVEFEDGVDAQWTLGVAEAGSLSMSRGGQVYARPAPPRRTLRVALGNLDERHAYGIGLPFDLWGRELGSNYLFDAAKHLGASGACLMVPRVKIADLPSGVDRDWIRRTAVYGHLTRPIEIAHRAGPYFTSSIDMVEEF